MSRALLEQTQVNIEMSLRVQVDGDDATRLAAALLLPLYWLAAFIWHARLWINRVRYEAAMFRRDVAEAVAFTGKVVAIAFTAWTWALGVRQ